MYLVKSLLDEDDANYDFECMNLDKGCGLITLYVELVLIHHTKDNKSAKEIWDTFKTLFVIVNTTQVNQLEIELSNLKMEDFDTIVEYVARFKKLKDDIIQVEGNDKIDLKLVSVVLNDLSLHSIFCFYIR